MAKKLDDDEVKLITQERFLEIIEKQKTLKIEIILFEKVDGLMLRLNDNMGYPFALRHLGSGDNVQKFLSYTQSAVMIEIIENCQFIESYFDFAPFLITNLYLDFDNKQLKGDFKFEAVFRAKKRAYKKRSLTKK